MGYPISGFQDLWEKLRGQSKAFNGADLRIGFIGGLRAMLHGVASSVALVRHDGCEDSCGFCHGREGPGKGVRSVWGYPGTVIALPTSL